MDFKEKYEKFIAEHLSDYDLKPILTKSAEGTGKKGRGKASAPSSALIYSEDFATVKYGVSHPMRPIRLKHTYDHILKHGLLSTPWCSEVLARPATMDEVLSYHTGEYMHALKASNSGIAPEKGALYGLGVGDNPVFKGVWDWSMLTTGASVQACQLIASGQAQRAFNMGGGLHHAMAARASGFCYINDVVVGINSLLKKGLRVAYVDIDAHHGDGVEAAYYKSDRVLTISLHEDGRYLFPGTGFPDRHGLEDGTGYSVNLPLPPGSDDYIFLSAFDSIVGPFINAFAPDVLVTQLGADSFKTDPITHLEITTNAFEEMLKRFSSSKLPWVLLGGGGYDLDNVRRAWTLAWAIASGAEDEERLNEVRDLPEDPRVKAEDQMAEVRPSIDYLLKTVLPLIKGPADSR